MEDRTKEFQLPGFPEFPTLFGEKEAARLQKLKEVAEKQKEVYRTHFLPEVWEKKPVIERAVGEVLARVYDPIAFKWLRDRTPWIEYGFTPYQADKFIRETELEIREVERAKKVVERVSDIKSYLIGMALLGKLTGEEAQLYELIPELDPRTDEFKRLPVTKKEREWFVNFNKALAGKSREELINLYTEGFPAPKNLDELMDLVKVSGLSKLSPEQILSTIALSSDIEQIREHLRLAYPPQVENPEQAFEERIKDKIEQSVEKDGVIPTGDIEKDMKEARIAHLQKIADEGIPDVITITGVPGLPGFPKTVVVSRKPDGIYFGGEKIANIDKEGKVVPLPPAEEYVLQETSKTMGDILRDTFPGISDEAIQAFWTMRSTKGSIAAWYKEYIDKSVTDPINLPVVGFLDYYSRQIPSHVFPQDLSLIPTKEIFGPHDHVMRAFFAGWGTAYYYTGSAARWLGYDGIAHTLMQRGKEQMRKMPQLASLEDFRWTNFFNPSFWGSPQFYQVVLQGVAMIPIAMSLFFAAVLGIYAGAAVTAKTAGAALTKKLFGTFGAKVVSKALGGLTGAAIVRIPEAIFEGGVAFDEALQRGASFEEADAAADRVFWDNMKLIGLDALQMGIAFARIPTPAKWTAFGITRGLFRLARVGGKIFIGGLTEGFEEYYQESIIRAAVGEKDPWRWDSEAQLAATLGWIMGAGFGVGGDILSSINSNLESYMTRGQSKAFNKVMESVKQELKSKGVEDKQAELTARIEALDTLAETEEGGALVEDATEAAIEEAYNSQIKDPKRRIYNKTISFIEKQLVKMESELASGIKQYNDLSVELKDAEPWRAVEIRQTLEDLRVDISYLRSQKEVAQSRLQQYKRLKEGVIEPKGKIASREKEEAWFKEAEPLVERIVERDAEGNITPGFHFVPVSGDTYYLLFTDEDSNVILTAKIEGKTVSNVAVKEGRLRADDWKVFLNHMLLNNLELESWSEMSYEAFKLHEESRGSPLSYSYLDVTPINDIIWDEGITPETKKATEEAIRALRKAVRFDVKRVRYDPTTWETENKISSYCPTTSTLWINYQPIEALNIFHELAHGISFMDVESGNFELWRAMFGENMVNNFIETIESEEVVNSFPVLNGLPRSQYMYETNELFKECEEVIARCLSEYCIGIPIEGSQKYELAIKNYLGGYEFKFSLSRESLIKTPAQRQLLLIAYSNIENVSDTREIYDKPSPVPGKTYDEWIKDSPAEAWNRLLDIAFGEGKPATPEGVYTLYKYMGLIPRGTLSVTKEGVSYIPTKDLRAIDVERTHEPEDLINGKAIDPEVASEQTAHLVGFPERTIDVGNLQQSEQEAARFINEVLYTADKENPLDVALVVAARTGNIKGYIDFLPHRIKLNISEEFKNAEFHDSPEWNLNFQPTLDAVSVIDGGKFGGALRKKVFNPAVHAELAVENYIASWVKRIADIEGSINLKRPSWFHPRARAKFDNVTYEVIDNISTEDVFLSNEQILAESPEIAEALKDYNQTDKDIILDYAKQIRLAFDEVLGNVNAVRLKLEREPIRYIEHYLPQVYKTNVWGKLLGLRIRPDFLPEQALAPDFIKPDAPFNPRALEREGGLRGYHKVKNVRKLLLDYVSVSAKEMFYTPVIINTKIHAKFLKNVKGLEAPSSFLMDWAMKSMAGLPDGFTKWRMKHLPPFLNYPAAFLRARLTPAVLGLNPVWNLFIQASAIAMTCLQAGIPNTIRGAVLYLTDAKTRQWVQNNCDSFILKQRGKGGIVYQDLGRTITERRKLEMSPLEKAEDIAMLLTNFFEKHFTGIACTAGKLRGQQLGITKTEDLVAFASDMGAKTQSMYDPLHMPGILSPSVTFIFPFQVFSIEVLTRVREMANIKWLPKAGTYQTVAATSIEGKSLIRLRLQRFLEFITAITVINMLAERAINRKPWEVSSFLPFWSIMMYGTDPHSRWHAPLPLRYLSDFWEGFDDVIKEDNWEKITQFFLRYHFPAGAQAWRTVDGILSVIRGEKEVRKGEFIKFEQDPETWIRAVTLGVWGTESGREWINRNIKNEPPSTQSLVKDMLEWEDQLGSSVKGEYYTLKDYGREVISVYKKLGIPEWQFLEEPIYPPLARFRVHCEAVWEEYNKLPVKRRIQYRINNPYVDATLYFWEEVRTVRTTKAKEELERIFEMFGADKNPRMHWRGLEVIPEYAKLLPD